MQIVLNRFRVDGVVYTGWSAAKTDAQRYGDAGRASCKDTSADAEGSVFAGDPEKVTVWSFEGYSPNKVLGVRLDEEHYTVFVADSVSDGDRDDLIRELREAKS